MSTEKYSIDEVCDRGRQIYEEHIKRLVEPLENGKFISIDIESGDYEIDEAELDASARLKRRRPDSVRFLAKIGCQSAYRIGLSGMEISD